MILTAIVGVLVLGAVIEWDRRLPAEGDTWARLGSLGRLLLVAGIPVGLAVAGLALTLLIDARTGEQQARGFYAGAVILVLLAILVGGLAIAAATVRGLRRLVRS